MATHFNAIIIGTGQAGPSLARRLAAAGQQVAVIEKGAFGGTCVNNGCTPTKTMVASARAAHMARRAADFGVDIGGPITVDMKKVKARKDAMVQPSTQGLEKDMHSRKNITVYKGHGRFTGPRTVAVNGEELSADRVYINVGGRPRIPEGYGEVPVLTNENIMDLEAVPEHLIVVGGSYIGLEFAQMFRRFGSQVTIIERNDRLVRREDAETSQALAKLLEGEGITLRLQATCLTGHPAPGGKIRVDVDCASGDREVVGTHLLLAVGRQPNTDDLGLEAAGIEKDARGFITVDDQLQTSVPGVYALGDCNGHGGFTHTAYNDFEIVAANLLDDDPRRLSDRIPCYALYTDPALAHVGLHEHAIRAQGIKALVGYRPMKRIARAKEKDETTGFVKIFVDAESHLFLGATILGIESDELIHSILDLMYAKAPYTVMSRAVHIHPTVSELLPTTLQGLQPLE